MPHPALAEETFDLEALRQLQRRKLAALLTEVRPHNAFYRQKFAGLESSFDPLTDRLDVLPFTTRAEIQQDQRDHPPYGRILTYPRQRYHRLHQTSGSEGVPLRWLDTPESWEWWKKCWATVYGGAGLRPDDRLTFPFSFGPFIGFWSAFEAAAALGNLCLPAGGMTTAARLRYLLDHETTFVCCTPTYALRMAEVAAEENINLAQSPVRGLIVAGEPGGNIPTVRARIETAWGARVFDHAGMTEIGAWGFECVAAPGGLHVIESEFIAEVIDPATERAMADGEAGELVLTNLGRPGSPLIRYRTGDQARLTRGRCACGRWSARAEGGVIGRIDDMLTIRGNNVFPSAIEALLREFPEVVEFRLEVERRGPLADLRIDLEPAAHADAPETARRVEKRLRDQLHFQPRVQTVPPGTLPRFEMKAKRLVRRNS